MKGLHSIISGTLILGLMACTPEPRPINYGQDACAFCKMTVVSRQHAAELVTAKGKVYVFDAIECMINYRQQHAETTFRFLLVNDYQNPGILIDATTCQYLISENLPSPMGAFLSAFEKKQAAQDMSAEKGGELYDWNGINQHFQTTGFNYFE